MADSANPLLCDSDIPRPRRLRVNPFTDQQLRLHLDILDLLQARRNPSFVEPGISGAHTTFEIELKLFDREGFGDQVQGRIGRET